MATGTQMVLEVKKNKLNNNSKWFSFGQKQDRKLQATVFLCTFYYSFSPEKSQINLISFN